MLALFASHPPLEKRIARLMPPAPPQAAYPQPYGQQQPYGPQPPYGPGR
jgi:hypothetical protein